MQVQKFSPTCLGDDGDSNKSIKQSKAGNETRPCMTLKPQQVSVSSHNSKSGVSHLKLTLLHTINTHRASFKTFSRPSLVLSHYPDFICVLLFQFEFVVPCVKCSLKRDIRGKTRKPFLHKK